MGCSKQTIANTTQQGPGLEFVQEEAQDDLDGRDQGVQEGQGGGPPQQPQARDGQSPQGLKVNTAIYIDVMKNVVKPWMDLVANGRLYVFHQDLAAAHKSRETQAWLLENLPNHLSPDLWPPSSPDCTPLDYFFWA
ncbi:Uncharacterized protein FKW44_020153 [Caligus rogercresseyi]|uniref:Transposase n=1 Tax=Caligus rogercresseyi TaxID=217165 RepID=A0A7T8JYX5_CALRO|nr:Uncharacterized protein FKW44_020153 [Caligus rogercresseyi]